MFSLSKRAAWQAAFTVYAVLGVIGTLIAWNKVPETPPCSAVSVESGHSISRRLLTLLVIVFTTGASTAMISPIYLIYVQDKFTTNVAVLAWAFFPAGILYSFLPSRLGKLSDRFGRALSMAISLGVAELLSVLLPKLPSIPWLVALYTLSSVGWSMTDPAESAMVADLTGQETRGRAYGVYKFTDNLEAAFGPLLGGWLYDALGQAVPFYFNRVVLFVSAAWILVSLKRDALA